MAVDLGKMIGPLPLGAWAGVVAGGLGIAYVARRGGGRAATEEAPPEYVYPATPSPVGPTILAPAPPTYPVQSLTTNSQWLAAAIPALVVKGFDPLKTQQCLQHFLEGTIPAGDPGNCRAAINEAIKELGPPPDGAPTNLNPLAPVPKAPTVAPSQPTQAAPTGPIRLQWVGAGLYGTDGGRRTRYALSPSAAGYFSRHYGVHGRPGSAAPPWWSATVRVPQNVLLGEIPSWWKPGHPSYRLHPGPRVY